MELSYFAIFVITQVAAISLIVWVLKRVLDDRLIDSAIKQLEFGEWGKERLPGILVVTHKDLKRPLRQRIQSIAQRRWGQATRPNFEVDKALLGGMVIKAGKQVIECSLKDRLQQAFPRNG